MWDVENARRAPYSEVFVGDTGVLHRHFPAAEPMESLPPSRWAKQRVLF
jgi:hypothetical protein